MSTFVVNAHDVAWKAHIALESYWSDASLIGCVCVCMCVYVCVCVCMCVHVCVFVCVCADVALVD